MINGLQSQASEEGLVMLGKRPGTMDQLEEGDDYEFTILKNTLRWLSFMKATPNVTTLGQSSLAEHNDRFKLEWS